MQFILVDRVTALEKGRRITAVKAVSLAEEYLADHFPNFPVLPGVLMIEALVQTAALLVRVTNDFAQSMVVLREARNIKYRSFVKPGHLLHLTLEAKTITTKESSFRSVATVEGQQMVEARLTLGHFNLADTDAKMASVDRQIIAEMKTRAQQLGAC